tara:strand:- start:2161 stop:2403 length:243 start_codon:yes stop_codon:yes gene_type:complete
MIKFVKCINDANAKINDAIFKIAALLIKSSFLDNRYSILQKMHQNQTYIYINYPVTRSISDAKIVGLSVIICQEINDFKD